MALVVVRGTGDVGSAVAHSLYRAGYSVALHDAAHAPHTRRGMAFVDALYRGTVELEGVLGKRVRDLRDLVVMVRCRRAVPVVAAPLADVLDAVRPDVLVDARMRKHEVPESQRGLAPLVIGLGPNFEAGANADAAIETKWGDELGTVLWTGRTADLAGEPQEIGGHARERYVYAPREGRFETAFDVGDAVTAGQEVPRIGDTPVHAPISGCLRGIAHAGAHVRMRAKILEVDPRADPARVRGLGERPRRIAQGVLEALQARNPGRDAAPG